ncbi:MAG: putative 2-aminoethylphosphonate ABC transporter substrate-binding protein [Geminicoccaceae bacterium]|nr:putative 2-aminoethylphosphonate ABC transporter substrate-binding protein [Geminicoccaceae bacterium]MDW8125159.1 putative 2-aminoethylphosphonate ABC transporter substrate-binding protein [Geminicoccaceae bacterium]MDW8340934.1 putative 2-aminoethylphosphonate ABC transporter substrate-binding protein [Geminicoccaceae bacterium]
MSPPRRTLRAALCAWVAVIAASSATAARAATELLVYTALEADQLKAYQSAFEAANPDVKIRWVRDSTGIVTAKLLAEKANPQADVVMGLAATSLMLLDKEGLLLPYAPKGLEKVKPGMRDPADPPKWVGMDVWSSAICFNTVEAAKRGLKPPASWADLLDPAYRGQITMPNPASSGTGFLMVSAWLQLMGEERGWAFMDALHQNVAAYTHSGSKPCRQAGAGEYVIGLSFEYRANKTKKDGAPIAIILPKEGLGWDMEAIGIIKTTRKLEAAKKLVDWAVSEEANRLYAQNFAIVALPGIASRLEHVPGDIEAMLIKNDFAWAAANRERILAEWTKRYDGKSEPRS